MRVLHTVASLQPETGGPARSVPGLANALTDQGLEIHVWSSDVPAEGLDSARFVLHRGSLGEALGQGEKWDLIHDHGLWLPVNHRVARAASERKVPRIVSPRGMLEPWALNHKKWKKRAAWWLYQRRDLNSAAALHATADSEALQFKHLGLRQQIQVIPNGVDLPPILQPASSNSNSRTAMFLGRVQSKKGLPMLVEAWAKVRPKGWRMRVIGPDEDGHRAELEAMVSKAGVADDWTFDGPMDDSQKASAFAAANLFVLPTFSENFGIAVAEALAAGVPVITTTGAPWSGLVDTKSGWWIEPTPEALAIALKDACGRTANDLHGMGGRGRDWMQRDFTWESVASRMIDAYNEVLVRF